jgi:hypothetical protein
MGAMEMQARQVARGLLPLEWETLCLILAQYGKGTVELGVRGKVLKSAAGRLKTKGLVVADGKHREKTTDGYGWRCFTIWRVTDLGRAVARAQIAEFE